MSDKKTEDKKNENCSKADRVARMEEKIDLLTEGMLTLINMVEWNNETITPIGTHNREVEITHFETLKQAIDTYKNEVPDGG